MSKLLANWPTGWCQLNDAPSEGLTAADPANDCGPESISEVWNWITGANLDANLIRAVEYASTNHKGYTDIQHMLNFLQQKAGIPAGLLTADPATLFDHICGWIDAGHPAIHLWWETTSSGGWVYGVGGHFCPVIGYNTDAAGNRISVVRSNPWTGTTQTLTRDQFINATQTYTQNGIQVGNAVCCNRSRDPQLGPIFA